MNHQFIDRSSGIVRTEALFGDRWVNLIYSDRRESAPVLFNTLTSARMSKLLAYVAFDMPLGDRLSGIVAFAERMGVDLSECLAPGELDTARKFFERRIRYWECRPLPDNPAAVVSPADARMVAGSFAETSSLFLKEKFFRYDELWGPGKAVWRRCFRNGDFAVFRLTPDKYHYNHVPVAGNVVDVYEVDGVYGPCNPGAVMAMATPYSKNRRVVTVIDTDVPGGTGAGLVAMIEIVALMIGDIRQCYSDERYDDPRPATPGMFLKKGRPKSLYRPGSSTDVLVFQPNRVRFSPDILQNQSRQDVTSRFSMGFGKPVIETEVRVRSEIGLPRQRRYARGGVR